MGNFLAGMAATLCVVGALIVGYLVGGGELGGDDSTEPTSQPQVRATVLGIRPTATPEPDPPTATPSPPAQAANVAALPDRTSCEEIYGTQFRSETERGFFFANCVPTTPTPEAAAVNQPSQPAQPAPPPQNRFTWGGSGGEYIAFSTSLCASGTVGYTVSGEYAGRSFCTQQRVAGMPPFTCPEGAFARVEEASSAGATIGEVFCIIPNDNSGGG
jgi:hypothetical protein